MIEEYNSAMLAALDRLVARYGPHQATYLAELLRDPKRTEQLAAALEIAAATAHRGKSKPKTERSDRVGMAVLKDLRLSDPDKHAVIAEIRSQLIASTILSSMDQLRRFAMMHDLSIGKTSSRTAAIAPFLRSLSQLSTPEIVSLRDSIIHSNVDDRSLDRWRDVIVRTRPSKSTAEETKP